MTFKQSILDGDVSVSCTTVERAIALLDWLHEQGYTWANGDQYTGTDTNWYNYGSNTIYYVGRGTFGDIREEGTISFEEAVASKTYVEPQVKPEIVGSLLVLKRPGYSHIPILPLDSTTKLGYDKNSISINGYPTKFDQELLTNIMKVINKSMGNSTSIENLIS